MPHYGRPLEHTTAAVARTEVEKYIRRLHQSQLTPNNGIRRDVISRSLESCIS